MAAALLALPALLAQFAGPRVDAQYPRAGTAPAAVLALEQDGAPAAATLQSQRSRALDTGAFTPVFVLPHGRPRPAAAPGARPAPAPPSPRLASRLCYAAGSGRSPPGHRQA